MGCKESNQTKIIASKSVQEALTMLTFDFQQSQYFVTLIFDRIFSENSIFTKELRYSGLVSQLKKILPLL